MKRKIHEETTDSRVYKNARISSLYLTKCPKCSPHKGCNRWAGGGHSNSWKDTTKRRSQWR